MRSTLFRCFIAGLAFIGLVSCGPTRYQAAEPGTSGMGYSENKLDPTTWSVTFRGSPDTTVEQVFTFWLYRCAEITAREGYTHFIRVDRRIGESGPAGHVVGHRWGGMIHNADAGPRVPVKGGGGMIFIPMYTGPSAPPPQSYGVIRLFKEVPEDQKGFAYNAAEILSQNAERVKASMPKN